MSADSFIKTYLPQAKQVSAKTGIPAESILAQAGLESGWKLNPPGNNFFGIKAGNSWSGNRILIRTKEILGNGTTKFPVIHSVTKRSDGKYLYDVSDYFRKYNTPADSFADWALLVKTKFPGAWQVRTDKAAFARALAHGGYATAPNYAEQLVSVLRSVERRLSLPLTTATGAAGGAILALVAGALVAALRSRAGA